MPKTGRYIYAKHILDEGLVSRIHTELLQLNNKKTTHIQIWAKNEQTFHQRYMNSNEHIKRCSTSLVIREIEIKTTMTIISCPLKKLYYVRQVRTMLVSMQRN